MAGLNKVEIIGRLGQDPEVRYLPNGDAVCNLSLATSEAWTDKQSGQKQERTEWHRVSMFGNVAEIAGKYLRKGSQCYVCGKLQTRKWEKDGIERYTTEIVVSGFDGRLLLLDSAPQGGNDNRPPQQGQQQRPQGQGNQQQRQQGQSQQRPQGQAGYGQQSAPQQQAADFDSFDDDIPF